MQLSAWVQLLTNPPPGTGFLISADLAYPAHLHAEHDDYPLAPVKRVVPEAQLGAHSRAVLQAVASGPHHPVPKLLATLDDRQDYVLHWRALREYTQLGMVVTAVHQVLRYREEAWLAKFVAHMIALRRAARSEAEKAFPKKVLNSLFGKTMENVREHKRVALALDEKAFQRQLRQPSYHSTLVVYPEVQEWERGGRDGSAGQGRVGSQGSEQQQGSGAGTPSSSSGRREWASGSGSSQQGGGSDREEGGNSQSGGGGGTVSQPDAHLPRAPADRDLVVVRHNRGRVLLDKPVYVGQAILDISKVWMYQFYGQVKRVFHARARLAMTDTDSLVCAIRSPDLAVELKQLQPLLDTGNYPASRAPPLRCNHNRGPRFVQR